MQSAANFKSLSRDVWPARNILSMNFNLTKRNTTQLMSSGLFTMQWLRMKQSKYGIVVIGYSVAPSWQALEPLPHTRFTGYLYLYNEFGIYISYFLPKALCITCTTLLIHRHLGWFFDLTSVALYFIQSYLLN